MGVGCEGGAGGQNYTKFYENFNPLERVGAVGGRGLIKLLFKILMVPNVIRLDYID